MPCSCGSFKNGLHRGYPFLILSYPFSFFCLSFSFFEIKGKSQPSLPIFRGAWSLLPSSCSLWPTPHRGHLKTHQLNGINFWEPRFQCTMNSLLLWRVRYAHATKQIASLLTRTHSAAIVFKKQFVATATVPKQGFPFRGRGSPHGTAKLRICDDKKQISFAHAGSPWDAKNHSFLQVRLCSWTLCAHLFEVREAGCRIFR